MKKTNRKFSGGAVKQSRAGDLGWFVDRGGQPSFEELVVMAKNGNVNAQIAVGRMLTQGIGVRRDERAGARMFAVAAKSGDSTAEYNLATAYWNGSGVRKNLATAAHWLALSAKQGDVDAMFAYGLLLSSGSGVRPDYSKAVMYFRRAAMRGHVGAARSLAKEYDFGDGTARSQKPRRAVFWYEKAARAGDVDSMVNLGVCYRRGRGVRVNRRKALLLFKRAAALGDALAKRHVAELKSEARSPPR